MTEGKMQENKKKTFMYKADRELKKEFFFLDKFFKLSDNQTNIHTEFFAGLITFMTMAYILAVNPEKAVPGEPLPFLECIDDIAHLDIEALCGAKTSVGTGGMQSKLMAARRAAQLGVPTLILPGRRPGILDRAFSGEAVGTIELFHREADEHFYECGLLRLDLRSDYETAGCIKNIISLIKESTFDLFYCKKIITMVQ